MVLDVHEFISSGKVILHHQV